MDVPVRVRNKLHLASGNKCAFEGCDKILTTENDAGHIAIICHIAGQNASGARYEANMSDEERNGYDNLIVLCPNHHAEIDNNPLKYTVEYLKNMKREHETRVRQKWMQEHPSFLSDVLSKITYLDNIEESAISHSFKIEDKISYNHVIKYRYIFDEFKIYHAKIDSLYSEIENENGRSKGIFLNNIRGLYLQAKGELLGSGATIDKVRKKADDLIERVEKKLKERVDMQGLQEEAVEYGLKIILVDAFMRCKILEEPV